MKHPGPVALTTTGLSSHSEWMLFSLAIITRLIVFGVNMGYAEPHVRTPDSASYVSTAISLETHLRSPDLEGQPSASRVPGYPLLLALAFALRLASPDHLGGAILLQILVSSVTVVLATRVAYWIGGTDAAWTTGVLMVVEPSSLAYANLIMSESLYAVGVTVAALAYARWVRRPDSLSLLWCAVVVGVLPLIRPVGLYLSVPMALMVYWTGSANGSRIRNATLFLAIVLLPACAWSYRNHHYFGLVSFDRNNALNKAIFARSVEETAGASPIDSPLKQPWQAYFGEDRALSQSEAMEIQEAYFQTVMKAHPWFALKRLALTGVMLLGVPDAHLAPQITGRENAFEEGTIYGRLRWLGAIGPLAALLVAGMLISIGSILSVPFLLTWSRRWERKRTTNLACLAVLIAYHVVLGGTQWHQGERHRVPIVPLMAAVLATGLVEFRMASRGRRASGQVA